MNKQVVAREWVWFVGCVLGTFAVTLVLDPLEWPGSLFWGMVLTYPAVAVFRFTVWAFRTAFTRPPR